MIYLDTSVLVAYYCFEPDSEIVEKVITKTKGPTISQLTEVELISAISKKVRDKSLAQMDGNRIITRFESHIGKQLFRWVPVQHEHYQIAKNWISQFDTPLRTLDALHLALTAAENLTLFTSDQQLIESAKNFGIDVISPSDNSYLTF